MRTLIGILMLSLLPYSAVAKPAQEAEDMGALAGAIMACGAHRQLYQFEEILSRYYSNSSPNQMAEDSLLKMYARAKANSFILQSKRSKKECGTTIYAFTSMAIFNSELYSDGTIKTPEGKFLFPRGQKALAQGAQRTYPAPK